MARNTRRKPTARLYRGLVEYFGHGCIVTGSEDYQWHHLDDDPSNTTFQNLVPLGSRLNSFLAGVRARTDRGDSPYLRAELSPHHLSTQATAYFNMWELGRAYGCARLAYFVSRDYLRQPPTIRLPFACQALYYCRNRLNYSFMLDVLRRDILPSLHEASTLGVSTLFRVVREFAGIYAEHGSTMKATALYDLADRYLGASDLSGADPASVAALLRRRATAQAAERGSCREASPLFEEAMHTAVGDENMEIGIINSRSWVEIDSARYGLALDLLEPKVKGFRRTIFANSRIQPADISIWNAAEMLQNYALALTGARPTRYRERRERALTEAKRLFDLSGAAAYDVREGFSSDSFKLLQSDGRQAVGASRTRRIVPAEIEAAMAEAMACIGSLR